MTVVEMQKGTAAKTARGPTIDMKLEVVVISVSDIDRAKRFYSDLGWRLDIECTDGRDYRVIQFTPPGSRCSVIFGKNVTNVAPGSAQGLHLIVSEIQASRRTAAPWHRDQRAIPRRRRHLPPCGRERHRRRPESSAKELRLVRLV